MNVRLVSTDCNVATVWSRHRRRRMKRAIKQDMTVRVPQMTDRLSKSQRSHLMAVVKNKDTAPEMWVRHTLFVAGYRFRLHDKRLPGSPDIVLPRFRIAVFVHGCFWHGHSCKRGNRPTSNVRFWNAKISANVARDARSKELLRQQGWLPVTLWSCSLGKRTAALVRKLAQRDGKLAP